MSSQCTVCQLFALYLKVCEEIKQQIWVAGLAQLRIVEVFRFPPPSEGHPAIWALPDMFWVFGVVSSWPSILVSDGFGSWHTGRVWRPPLVHRCPGLTWLGGQRTTFAGEHSLGDLFEVEHQWPIAFRWSFRCLPQWGSHVLGWHDHFYIQESGIYPKCDISSST